MSYKAPVKEMRFLINDLFDFHKQYKTIKDYEDVDKELTDTIIDEYTKFCESEVMPLNRSGDEQGCRFIDGKVSTPSGFKQAYEQYTEAGWKALPWDPQYGGQGLPKSLNKVLLESLASSNMSFSLYASAQPGAIETLSAFGTEEQKSSYLPKLISGKWNATMCLTEPHCGTDLGLINTKAEVRADRSYSVSGTKIFITGGDHDLNENIIHLVLARIPGSPAGNAGISLFVVPKYLPTNGGLVKDLNGVSCGSIESKMGVKASATCVMNFDNSTGFLLGEPNKGVKAMFTFINASRISAAFQGVAHAEFGFQKSLVYARERLQMRASNGPTHPHLAADPIIVHPDVRRMLLTQKAYAQGNRMLCYDLALQLDLAEKAPDVEAREKAQCRLELLTPIAKAFATETGLESANLALQCFGGHGYIREWGVEQNVRDARIATLYEGTTGIQALDLIGRKVLGGSGELLNNFIDEILEFCSANEGLNLPIILALQSACQDWLRLTTDIANKSRVNGDAMGAASVPYLMFAGHVCLLYYFARATALCTEALRQNSSASEAFFNEKLNVAGFYLNHLFPKTSSYAAIMSAGASDLSIE